MKLSEIDGILRLVSASGKCHGYYDELEDALQDAEQFLSAQIQRRINGEWTTIQTLKSMHCDHINSKTEYQIGENGCVTFWSYEYPVQLTLKELRALCVIVETFSQIQREDHD